MTKLRRWSFLYLSEQKNKMKVRIKIMRKSKIISGLLALALVCTTALPMNINVASAATSTQGNDNAQV